MVADGRPVLEFCGGTHLDNTAKAGLFHISPRVLHASGVRRIEAVTGPKCWRCWQSDDETIVKAAEAMKANPAELVRKAEQTVAELKEARRVIEQYKAKESPAVQMSP